MVKSLARVKNIIHMKGELKVVLTIMKKKISNKIIISVTIVRSIATLSINRNLRRLQKSKLMKCNLLIMKTQTQMNFD